MKKVFYIVTLLSIYSCQKTEPAAECKTCELTVDYSSNTGGYQHYIAETREICDGSWQSLDGKVDGQSGSGTSGTTHWTRHMVWHCK